MSSTVAVVVRKHFNNLESTMNGKLKSHVLFWKFWLFGQIPMFLSTSELKCHTELLQLHLT